MLSYVLALLLLLGLLAPLHLPINQLQLRLRDHQSEIFLTF